MDIKRFKSKLTKGEIEAMAIDTVRKYLDTANALDILEFAKKLNHFAGVFVKESESEAKMIWDNHKLEHPNMNYTTGGAIYDWDKDPVYMSIKVMMQERLSLLKTAVLSSKPIYDEEGTEVPKCPIKGYRKDSINVKL